MGKCDYCGAEVLIPFECSFCGGKFCMGHRLPENHDCIRAPKRTPLGPWYAKKPAEKKPVKVPSEPLPTPKKKVASEGRFHFVKGEPSSKPKKPIKRIITVLIVVAIIFVILWNAPTIILTVQNLLSQSSYTTVTVYRSSAGEFKTKTLQLGDTEYSFVYHRTNHFSVSTPLLETKTYTPVEGAVYRDFGIEIKVSEVNLDYIVLSVKPTVQNYLAQSSFKKLTIAEGQYQTISFNGNEYTITYTGNNQIAVMTPLLQYKTYYINSGTIHSDLGIEIRVYKVFPEYIIIFVKSIY